MLSLQKHLYRAVPSISMPACGDFLVVMEEASPVVIKFPDVLACDVDPSREIVSKTTECQDIRTLGSTELSQFGFHHGQALNNASLVSCRDGTVSSVVTITGGSEPTIRLTTGTGQPDQSLKLMSLPPSVEMTHATPTIILPERKDDPLHIAINMNPRQEYSMGGLPNRRLPALIERDVRALKQVSTSAERRDLSIMPAEKP